MTLDEALITACQAVHINPPKRMAQGKWLRTDTYEKNGKGDAAVMVFPDGKGVSVVNWQTQQRATVWIDGVAPPEQYRARRDQDRQDAQDREAVAQICGRIVETCRQDKHSYLARKGFPDELGLVHDNPRDCLPDGALGDAISRSLPSCAEPLLIIPGRVGGNLTTVQFITPDGDKKNIYRGAMSGAAHRIASGRQTVACEGIATALSVRAALRLLGVSATVLSAFAAANVAKVTSGIPGAMIAADHDKPIPQLHGLGTGEFYARGSGCKWTMPPERGDFNDMHTRDGLRAVAVHLQGALMPP